MVTVDQQNLISRKKSWKARLGVIGDGGSGAGQTLQPSGSAGA